MANKLKEMEAVALKAIVSKLETMSVISIALWLSALAHAIILSIHFEPELKKFKDQLPILEVVLVNAKTAARPDNTEVYAQANLDRGGNTELDRKMQTTLPLLKPQKAEFTLKPDALTKQSASQTNPSLEETKTLKRVAELEKEAQALMTQINTHKVDSSVSAHQPNAKATESENKPTPNRELNLNDLTATALEMDRLEALISKQQDEYQKRPKRKFVGGRAKEYRYALYVEAWRQKVEKIGNLNYPEAAKNLKLYGQLQMTVSIKADGSIENIEINRSSGHKVLDAAAQHIVELGAPYARFPDDVSREIDILSITRTWTFTKEDNLATE